jgi:hypothetical protein
MKPRRYEMRLCIGALLVSGFSGLFSSQLSAYRGFRNGLMHLWLPSGRNADQPENPRRSGDHGPSGPQSQV